jgi:hypothetical protein
MTILVFSLDSAAGTTLIVAGLAGSGRLSSGACVIAGLLLMADAASRLFVLMGGAL